MAIRAICVRCGKPKKDAFASCRACGLLPETEYQMGRALIFSLTKTVGGVPVGRDARTLKALSAQIQSGRFYEFDPKEEQRAVDAYRVYRKNEDGRRARRKHVAWISMVAVLVIALLAGSFLLATQG